MPKYSRTTYAKMARDIALIAEELKRRNPIGVNMYHGAVVNASLAMLEVSEGEKWNFTSECGPVEVDSP